MRRKIKDNKHLLWDGSVLNNVLGITPQLYISRPNILSGVASPNGLLLQNLNNIGKDYSYPSTSNFNMGYVTGAIDSIGSITNTLNNPTLNIYDAVYSDGSQDPIGRFINDVTGRNTQTAINQVNQSRIKNANAKTLDDVALMYANYSTIPLLSRSKNNALNAVGFTAMGAPWLSYNQNGKLSFDAGNLKSFAQGASKGALFGGPWGALWGGVAGGLFNVFSRIGLNRRIRKINRAIKNVNQYNLRALENLKTNVLLDNMSNMLRNYAAYGGPILGALDYEIANKNLNNYENRTSANASNIIPYFQALNTFSDGGSIHIKPENRGKFTRLKERTGKSATWFKEHGTPAQKKMATFALNSRKWKHDIGGPLSSLVEDINERSNADFVQRLLDPNRDYILDWESDNIATHKLGWATDDEGAIVFPNVQKINGKLYDFTDPKNKRGEWDALDSAIERGDTLRMTPAQAEEFTKTYKKYYPKGKTFKAFGGSLLTHGGDWSNGLTWFNNGGSHEENPYDGIPLGIAPDGKPNLVEEGEVKYNDYIFSNRLTVPEDMTKKYKLKDNTTFANAIKKLSKEAEERPNDNISKNYLNSVLNDLIQSQEEVRLTKQLEELYANGGHLFYSGGSEIPYYVDYIDPTILAILNYNDINNLINRNPKLNHKRDSGRHPSPLIVPYIQTTNTALNLDNISKSNTNSVKRAKTTTNNSIENNIIDRSPITQLVMAPKLISIKQPVITGTPFANIYDANAVIPEEQAKSNNDESNVTWLRYAPVLGSTIGLTTGLLSKPNYGNAKRIEDAARNAGQYTPISYNPLGDYLSYNPLDINYMANQLRASEQAAARNILNTSGGNRGTAMAGLLANTYNSQLALGDAYRKAQEANLAQRLQVEKFNRETNKLNSLGFLEADKANQEALLKSQAQYLEGIERGALTRLAIKDARDASLSANFTNLFNSLGDIGREAYSRNMVNLNPALYYSIKNGKITYKNSFDELSEYEKSLIRKDAEKKIKRKGGYLTINR